MRFYRGFSMNIGMVLTEKLEEREKIILKLHQDGDENGDQL